MQEGDPMPEDWRTLVDSDLFKVDTSKVPEVTLPLQPSILCVVNVILGEVACVIC